MTLSFFMKKADSGSKSQVKTASGLIHRMTQRHAENRNALFAKIVLTLSSKASSPEKPASFRSRNTGCPCANICLNGNFSPKHKAFYFR
jgi:hypothetical protein